MSTMTKAQRAEARAAAQKQKQDAAKAKAKANPVKKVHDTWTDGPLKEAAVKKPKTAAAQTNYAPTTEVAGQLQEAFDFFNAKLFDGALPAPMLSFARLKKAHGYFWAKQWKRTGQKQHDTHEIALDPYRCSQEKDKDVLGTLVHEMVHLQDQENGTAPKRVYHTKIWAGLMKNVGLHPSTTGAPGGKETGPNCTHYIVKGGVFDEAADALIANGFKFTWHCAQPLEAEKAGKKKKKAGAKAKHTCPECEANAWGKPTLHLMCGDCEVKMDCPDRDEYEGDDDDAS